MHVQLGSIGQLERGLWMRKGKVSTTRIVVLITVLVFGVVYIKLGWVAGSFESFVIDTGWIYILGLAFGGKAFQRFAENDEGES